MRQKILIIDDDRILAGLLQLTLELEGYDVAVVSDGGQGLKRIESESFDLILLDLVMPGIDGLKFLRLLSDSGLARPPVMIVSSAIDEGLTPHHRGLGVVDIARKPIEPAQLVIRAKRVLDSTQTKVED